MPILILLFILLCFPALEIYTLFRVADVIGWWLAVWLVASGVMGVWLIRLEKLAFHGRLLFSLQVGKSPLAAIFDSSRNLLAGVLLIFPGVISDVIAMILLLLPSPRNNGIEVPVQDGVIEGSYRREEDSAKDKLTHSDGSHN
jgi:UPF0716 protein FxsA